MKLFGDGARSKTRINHTRLLAAAFFVLLMVSGNRVMNNYSKGIFDIAGLSCIIVCSFGRIWASVYISGYKTGTLISVGPYSITRNPLYLFSLIGAVGLGLAVRSVSLFLLIGTMFALYYPFVIRREEERLEEEHGEDFQIYKDRVPTFFPKFSLFSEPETYVLQTKQFRRALVDASYFFWLYGGLQLIHRLREVGILPTYFRIP